MQASIASNRRIDSSLARARRTQQARRSRRATHDRAPLLAAPSCGIGSADPRPRRRRAAATLATATACCNAASPAGRERGRGCARGATGYAAAALARRAPLTFMGRTPWRKARDRVTAGIRPDAAMTRVRPRPARTRLSAAGMGDRAGSDRLATNPHQSARANRLDVADR
ncbi:thymidylate synthase [Burkholderia pseudomallei]|uniref:thymidylate synthase n=1 Tax=Burkholderia pseudomallei TaxID=28450 RepID=UPI0015C3A4FE|nr:thymidylate synthase [Burkholderia pseudomallei]